MVSFSRKLLVSESARPAPLAFSRCDERAPLVNQDEPTGRWKDGPALAGGHLWARTNSPMGRTQRVGWA